jgi:hypothetical protein
VDHEVTVSDVLICTVGESTEIYMLESMDAYRIEITPREEGTMTFAVTTYDPENATETRRVCDQIVINPSQVYTLSVAQDYEEFEDPETKYDLLCLEDGEETVIEVTELLTEEMFVTVSVNAEEGGFVTGDGTYPRADTVALTAEAEPGFVFTGWYLNGELAEESAEWYLIAREDMELTAGFARIAEIRELTCEGETVTARVRCFDESASVFCAVYGERGQLLGTRILPRTLAEDTYEFSFAGLPFVRAMLFVVDGDLAPLCAAAEAATAEQDPPG